MVIFETLARRGLFPSMNENLFSGSDRCRQLLLYRKTTGQVFKKVPSIRSHARVDAVSFGKVAYELSTTLEDKLGTWIYQYAGFM